MVRIFDDGRMIAEIIPEIWLMNRQNSVLQGNFKQERAGDLAVLVKE